MADDAPDEGATEVATTSGALLKGDVSSRAVMGWATVTNERLLFTHQRYNPGMATAVGGVLSSLMADRLQRRHQVREGPVRHIPLGDIRRLSRGSFRLNRNVLVLDLADGRTASVSDGFKQLHEELRRVLTERHGKRLVPQGEGSWRVD